MKIKNNFLIKLLIIFGLIIGSLPNLVQSQEIPTQNYEHNLKIAQLTDVHIDSEGNYKKSRMLAESSALLSDAIHQMNEIKDLDLVVFSGDVINRAKIEYLKKFIKLANKINVPWLAVMGNHDIGYAGGVTKEQFMNELSSENNNINSKKSYYYHLAGKKYILVFLDGVIDKVVSANGFFPKEELVWLDKTLTKFSNRNAILIQHFPVVQPFNSTSHLVFNAQEYLDLIDKHQNVIAVISGHYHASKAQKRNEVLHISTPALVEYPNAFRIINFRDNGKNIEISSETHATRLKSIQNKSKEKQKENAVHEGNEIDQNFKIYLNKTSLIKKSKPIYSHHANK